ncbi:transposase [Hyalangium versicolor]|uniref:transposase n=1 Tax=Hyalangium versicolor TaxID=2861190 RepID=UPI0028153AF0|nr:transposase [Hyalangium versicolor]
MSDALFVRIRGGLALGQRWLTGAQQQSARHNELEWTRKSHGTFFVTCGMAHYTAVRLGRERCSVRLLYSASWAHSPERRKEARIPPEVTFKTKPQLALEMIRRALKQHAFVYFGMIQLMLGHLA